MIAALVALGLLAGAAVWDYLDDDEPGSGGRVEPDEPETPDGPDEPDLGATVIENEDGTVNIELGEDETGSLVALRLAQEYNPASSSGLGQADTHSLHLFLMPEGVSFPSSMDYLPDNKGSQHWDMFDLAEELGLEPLASFEL
ncbi:MAG: hypothetical protein ACU0BK_08040 [Shimia sp.]|uniref:hypothetical protein n=1 Tax=Shimia sp. TaxID=1954381 RepID=UPI0040589685